MIRHRSPTHLNFVRGMRCTGCRTNGPCHAHHLMHAQPSAMGLRSGDQWAVPLCHLCHDSLHRRGDERAWWAERGIDPLTLATQLWDMSPGRVADPLPGERLPRPPRRARFKARGKEDAA